MKQISIKASFTLVFLFALSTAWTQGAGSAADKIIGIYWSPNKDAKIEIYKKADQYFGRTIWLSTPKKDVENPDKKLRNRDLLGVDLLTHFAYDDGSYSDGEIYDPVSGKTYSCHINFSGKNLKVRGYVGISLFGRTEVFERVQ